MKKFIIAAAIIFTTGLVSAQAKDKNVLGTADFFDKNVLGTADLKDKNVLGTADLF